MRGCFACDCMEGLCACWCAWVQERVSVGWCLEGRKYTASAEVRRRLMARGHDDSCVVTHLPTVWLYRLTAVCSACHGLSLPTVCLCPCETLRPLSSPTESLEHLHILMPVCFSPCIIQNIGHVQGSRWASCRQVLICTDAHGLQQGHSRFT